MDDQRLKKFFHFNNTDLFNNHNGRLSENQARRLEEELKAEQKSARESARILVVIASLGLGAGLLIVVNAPVLAGKILIGLMLCVLWPLAWGWKAWQVWMSAPAERQEQVRAVRGSARVIRYEEDVMLEVGERQFDLEKNPSGLIADGDELIVYYLERTEEILSVDAL